MKSLKEYYGYGSTYSSSLANRKSVYRDMDPKVKEDLDKMAIQKFGRTFLNCSWEEQSGLRSEYEKEK